MEAATIHDMRKLLSAESSEYWNTHYTFDTVSPSKNKKLGNVAIDNIIINTVVPFMFVYADYRGIEDYKDIAVSLLEELDTTRVEPLAHPLDTQTVFREDVVGASLTTAEALQSAPRHDGQHFLVPAVLGESGAA